MKSNKIAILENLMWDMLIVVCMLIAADFARQYSYWFAIIIGVIAANVVKVVALKQLSLTHVIKTKTNISR